MTVIAVIGLGYVGLPLAVEFGKRFKTIGFDLNQHKIDTYKQAIDPTNEITKADFEAADKLTVTTDPTTIAEANYIIVTVPTPIDDAQRPDFNFLIKASETVGRNMKPGAIVIYESTVYPGATEEVCVPILEESSAMKWRHDFHIGYSPERINPGDKQHTLTKIVKVVAGDDNDTLEKIARLYETIIEAGVHRTTDIKTAEAAKVIENTQRDLNIALVNELAMIFDRMDIDTLEVLEAAGTKWNFLPFRPGLVGGHCIGVDPYYLTHKADKIGYHPHVILAGRRINDNMGKFIAEKTIKKMIDAKNVIKGAKIIVLGLAFKENCPDLRNSRVIDIIDELKDYGAEVLVHDPVTAAADALQEYGIALTHWQDLPAADAMVVAVAHQCFLDLPIKDLVTRIQPGGLFIDVKSCFDYQALEDSGLSVWRL